MTKEAIKHLVTNGAIIEFDYKEKISSWYSKIKIYKLDNFYYVERPYIKFADIDEAVNYFCSIAFTSKNIGYLQNRLRDKKLVGENTDFEKPSTKIRKLFKEEAKLVDEEAKSLNITVKEFPKAKDAISEFKVLADNATIDTLKDKLTDFDNKYSTRNPYISVSCVYDVEDSIYGYRAEFDYEDISPEIIEEYKSKSISNNKMTWKCLEIVLKVDGDGEYYRHQLSI